MRFLFYSHDGVGLGHVRRHLAISTALAELSPNAQVLLATSVDEVSHLGLPPNVDTLKLPGLRKMANNQYSSRRLSLPTSEIRALRANLLETAVRSFRPAVVLVDKHPFGAGGEFRVALEAARAAGARTALGLRDILDDKTSVLNDWAMERLQERIPAFYDRVLIYGMQQVFDTAQEYQFQGALVERTKYCNYVVNRSGCSWHSTDCPYLLVEPERAEQRPVVLATTGGGEDGFEVLRTFIGAAAGSPWKGVVVAGPLLGPSELKILEGLAAQNDVRFHAFLPCLASLFGSVNALVCMGGYNTLVESVSQMVPTVCVPRAKPRSEQLLRAKAFERLGLVRTIHPEQLTVEKLRRQIGFVLEAPRRQAGPGSAMMFDGAQRAAAHLLELMSAVRRSKNGHLERMVSK